MTGLVLALGIFFVYQFMINWLYPPRPRATPPPGTEQPAPVSQPVPVSPVPGSAPAAEAPASGSPATAAASFSLTPGLSVEPIVLGRPEDRLALTLSPIGAGVNSIRLTTRGRDEYAYAATAKGDTPYEIVAPQVTFTDTYSSFQTSQLQIRELDDARWPLNDLTWQVDEEAPDHATFSTTLRTAGDKQEWLRIRKTYRLVPERPLFEMTLSVENLSDRTLTVTLTQEAATGIAAESGTGEMRRVIVAQRTGGAGEGGAGAPSAGWQVELAKTVQRDALAKAGATGERLFTASPETSFAWVALVNRFFGVFVRPLEGTVVAVDGTVANPGSAQPAGDLVTRLVAVPSPVAPQQTLQLKFEVYAGPKDPDVLSGVNPAYGDKTQVNYALAQAADTRCCTFEPLPQIMVALLHGIYFVVRNYGVAIIILVIIVRTLLHPLSVYQQKSMYRMQDSMARVQPKMQAIKEKYANDRTRMNQEMMKLYSEEGVNPMGSLVGMLPLFIQMPILVALWTGLNMDIALRHAPFDGWWIRDLAAPDALISFSAPITIPILGQLPWIGRMFQGIPALNLLPVLMGVSMWLQQKYMPKPGMQARSDAAKAAPPPGERKPGQLTPEEQLRQQQMVGYIMTVVFPLMFYYMPSGLNLYWMATNVFGIGESLIIRKQIREEKERREREGYRPPPKKPGFVARFMKKMAQQAEELQRKADALGDQDKTRRDPKKP